LGFHPVAVVILHVHKHAHVLCIRKKPFLYLRISTAGCRDCRKQRHHEEVEKYLSFDHY